MMPMTADTKSARRLAWIVGGVLALGLAVYFGFLAPESEGTKGIGIGLILEKQEEFRRDLIRQGKHLNELETWQIQEELARRCGLSRSGVKGFVRRATMATDDLLKIDALLLSGDLESAVDLAHQQGAALAQTNPGAAARALRQEADALWRGGQMANAATAYAGAASLASKPDAAGLNLDLALLHWLQANFHPEDVRAELEAAGRAVAAALAAMPADKEPIDRAGAKRLEGNVLLRLAVLPDPQDPDVQRLDRDRMAAAELAFQEAFRSVTKEIAPNLWAAIAHDLGVVLLENASTRADAEARQLLSEAADFFGRALEVRNGRMPGGAVDPGALGEQLSLRAESLAFKAAALALRCEGSDGDAGRNDATETLATTAAALSLSTSSDPSPAWLTAQWAQGTALREQARIDAGVGHPAETAAIRARKMLAESAEHFLAALKEYPLELDGLPGMPDRKQILWSLQRTCDRIRTSPGLAGDGEIAGKVADAVRHLSSSLDKNTWKRTWLAAMSTEASAHLILGQAAATEDARQRHLSEATRLLSAIQRMAHDAGPVLSTPEGKPADPWRIPWPPDRLWQEQIQEMQRVLDDFRR